MSEKKKAFLHRFGLPILFSLIVFAILLITSIIIVLTTLLLVRLRAINLVKISGYKPLLPILLLVIISVLVGTIVSLVISRIPLKPIRLVIDATNRLAAGDFTARLRLARRACIHRACGKL